MKKLIHVLSHASLATLIGTMVWMALYSASSVGLPQLLLMLGVNLLIQSYFYEEK